MNLTEKKHLKKILNYNGFTILLIVSMLIWGPFFFDLIMGGDIPILSVDYELPSAVTIILVDLVIALLLLSRLWRDHLIKSVLFPKVDLTNEHYDRCLLKIKKLYRLTENRRMQKDKFAERTEDFYKAIDYFTHRINELKY